MRASQWNHYQRLRVIGKETIPAQSVAGSLWRVTTTSSHAICVGLTQQTRGDNKVFDRHDICEAYLCLEHDYGSHGWLQERGVRRDGTAKQVTVQLERMGFKPSQLLDSLSDNGREIYLRFVEWHGAVRGMVMGHIPCM